MEAVTGNSTQRDERIDLLKGSAILLVVLGHLEQPKGGAVFNFIYSFHMPLFAFLGGCTFQYSFEKRNGRMGNPVKTATSLIRDRVVTLMIPYICWSVIKSCIMKTTLAGAMVDYWFLSMLFGVTAAVAAAWSLCRIDKSANSRGAAVLLDILTVLAVTLLSFALFKATGLRTFRQMAIYSAPFCLGAYVKKYARWEKVFTSSAVSTAAILCYCVLLPLYSADDKSMAVLAVRFVCGVCFTQILYTFVSVLPVKAESWWASESPIKRALLWFGANSLSVYMIHEFFSRLFDGSILGGTLFYDTLIRLFGAVIICGLSILIAHVLGISKTLDFLLFGHSSKTGGMKTGTKKA